jgi:acetyl-CoA C-acetyltransferase
LIDIVIVSYSRTPLGAFLGSLSSFSAIDLGKHALAGALEQSTLQAKDIEQVIFGNVLSANLGQAPAKQIAIGAGIPTSAVCTTVNQVCASGMKAIIIGAAEIKLGNAEIAAVGGTESMSNVPFYFPKARQGNKLGHTEMVDGLIKDGLWDPYNNVHMGEAGEECAARYKKTREDQDAFALLSYTRAAEASKLDVVIKHINPLKMPRTNALISADEQITKNDPAKMKTLRPAFREGGTVTAANASSLNDGAAALIISSGKRATSSSLPVLARIVASAEVSQDPILFTTSPAIAVKKALEKANLTLNDIDFFEINEAFSVVALANIEILGIDVNKVNVFGGAVALGHPLGCSGARIVTTLLSVLEHRKGRYGCASVCNGGGGASAIIIEYLHK